MLLLQTSYGKLQTTALDTRYGNPVLNSKIQKQIIEYREAETIWYKTGAKQTQVRIQDLFLTLSIGLAFGKIIPSLGRWQLADGIISDLFPPCCPIQLRAKPSDNQKFGEPLLPPPLLL